MLKTIYVFWPLVLGEFHCCGKTNRCFLLSCCHFSQSCRDRTGHNLYHVPDLLRALAPQASAACRDSGQSRAQRSLPVLWCKAPSCCRVAVSYGHRWTRPPGTWAQDPAWIPLYLPWQESLYLQCTVWPNQTQGDAGFYRGWSGGPSAEASKPFGVTFWPKRNKMGEAWKK